MNICISGPGGVHDNAVSASFIQGYESTGGTWSGVFHMQGIGFKDAMDYAQTNDCTMHVRSTTGVLNYIDIAVDYYPDILTVIPAGSNDFTLAYNEDIHNIVVTGAGDLNNETAYKIEFFSHDPITGEPDYSSNSNGYVAGQLAYIKDQRVSNWWEARYSARMTANQSGSYHSTDGYGKIDIDDAILYASSIIDDPYISESPTGYTDQTKIPLLFDFNQTKKELTLEIWKRILNNLPYLYKTKGTKRGLQALISCYGIPENILEIREYGGPDVDTSNITEYTFDNFSYALDFSASLVGIPWISSSDEYPASVQFRFLTETVPANSMSLVEVNNGSELKWGLEAIPTTGNKGKINFKILSDTSTYTSVSSSELPLFDNNFNSITIQRTSASDAAIDQTYELYVKKYLYEEILDYDFNDVTITETSGNLGWVTSDSYFYIGGHDYLADPLVASFDELRFWNVNLQDRIIEKHVKHPTSIIGNTITGSYDDLVLRIAFDNPTNHNADSSGSLRNESPSELYPTASMEIYGFESAQIFPYNYSGHNYYSTTHFSNIGGARWANKIRIESSSLDGVLRHDQKIEKSQYDLAPNDSNKVGIYFSPTNPVDENIIEFMGIENIGNLIGNPAELYSSSYSELISLNNLYWDLSDRKISINDYLTYIRRYDKSLFENIKKFLPARVKAILGLVYEPHILERNKVKYTKPTIENLIHETLITSSLDLPGTKNDLNVTLDINDGLEIPTDYILNESLIDISDTFDIEESKDDYSKTIDISDTLNIEESKDDYATEIYTDLTLSCDYSTYDTIIESDEIYQVNAQDLEKLNIYSIIDISTDISFSSSVYNDFTGISNTRRSLGIGGPDYATVDRQEFYRLPNGLTLLENYTETRLTSSVFEMIVPYVNFERENDILNTIDPVPFHSSVYQIYNYTGTYTGSLGESGIGVGVYYSKYHYKWLKTFSTAENRLRYWGCKNTIETTFDKKEPIETWYSNPNAIIADDLNDSYVSVQ